MSEWVSDVHWEGDIVTENGTESNKDGTIIWNWTNQKPDWINEKGGGQIRVTGGLVDTIVIFSKIRGFF